MIASRDIFYGQDMVMYYHIFLDSNYYKLDELGLNYLNDFISFFSNDFFFFSIVYAVIINFLLLYLLKLCDRENYILLFIFFTSYFIFYQLNFNIYRQGLAIIISLLGLLLYSKNRLFLLLLFVAILFHKAAILTLVFFILSFIKFRRYYCLIGLFISLIPIPDNIYIFLAEVVGEYIPILKQSLTEYIRVVRVGVIGAASLDQKNIPIIISLLFIYFSKVKINKLQENIFIVYVWGVIFASIFKGNVIIYDRVLLYSQILFPYVLFFILKNIFPSKNKVLYVSLASVQVLITVLIWGPRNFLPDYLFYMF
ncbi:EpsG family protein [Pragia fontium]|uniref:EpsG family protein n=1 Tax=Pragia fontium TaxID=82985 RepID=UPI0013E05E28|nr:EpsG family protein [Pragia fontium]